MLNQTQSMIASIVLLNLLGQLSPGPDMLLISKTALNYSRWAAFWVALGITTGVAFWLLLTIEGYSALLQQLPWLQNTLMLAGGSYLIYCGYQMLRTVIPKNNSITAPIQEKHFFWKGLITNLSNPKIIFYLGSVMSMAMTNVHKPTLKYEIMLILLVQVLLTLCLMIWLFSLPVIKRNYLHWSLAIDRIGGCAFICFGCWLYIQIITSLLYH